MRTDKHVKGFTMVELIIVISVMSIISVLVSIMLKTPIQGYADSKRRAELSDESIGIYRQMERELRKSLPNSIRTTTDSGGKTYLEFLPVVGVGRYRMEQNATATGDVLDFAVADSSFDVLGPAISIVSGNEIVVNNLGVSGFDVWNGDTVSAFSGVAGSPSNISITAKKYPAASPTGKFFVIEKPVTWVCDPIAKTITRYSGYSRQSSQPNSTSLAPLSSASSSLASKDVLSCSFGFSAATSARNGIVSLLVSVARDGEQVSLFGEVNVPSTP